jgi:hypothetical protein
MMLMVMMMEVISIAWREMQWKCGCDEQCSLLDSLFIIFFPQRYGWLARLGILKNSRERASLAGPTQDRRRTDAPGKQSSKDTKTSSEPPASLFYSLSLVHLSFIILLSVGLDYFERETNE